MHRARPLLVTSALVSVALLSASCGGSAPPARVTSPTSPADLRVFDHGVDLVDDPDILGGHWRESWGEELQARVGAADIIQLVRVNSAQATHIPDQGPSYRLDIEPDGEALLGASTDIDLLSTEGDGGYVSIDRNQTRLLSTDFVLYIKWYNGEAGAISAHWYFSPATPAVVRRIQYLIERRRTAPEDQSRTVVHEN